MTAEIKQFVKDIKEELCGAEHYAKLATQYKDIDRETADMYNKLAIVELDHVSMLHAQVVRHIKLKNEPAPASMQAVWDWEHEEMVEKEASIRQLLAMYRS